MIVRSRLGRTVVAVAAVGACVLAGFEITVRFDDWARFGVPLWSPATNLEELFVRDTDGGHARPGAAWRQFRINALGFRGPEYHPSLDRKGLLVVTAGASETFGLYESPGREWPQQLADSLRALCSETPVTVLNAAFAGMSLPTVIQDLRLRVLPLHPKVVVYYPTPSQYLEGWPPRATPPALGHAPPLDPWRSRALPRIRDAVKRTIPQFVLDFLRRAATSRRAARVTPFDSVPPDRLDSLETQLRTLIGVVRHGGAELVVGIHQNRFADTSSVGERRWLRAWQFQIPKATAPILLQMERLAADRVRRAASDSGVPVFDPKLSSRPDHAALFADYLHFTDSGAAIMARSAAAQVAPLMGCSAASVKAQPRH